MKIKLWKGEYEFDKADAEIAVPLVLIGLALAFTPLNKVWLLGGIGAYYLLYFFLKPLVNGVGGLFKRFHHWRVSRCPFCKSHDVFLQGYEGYHSDEFYGWYLCNHCGETLILINDRFIKPGPGRGAKQMKAAK
jgi:hypothetical protein